MITSNLKDREAYRLMFATYPDVVNINELCQMLGGISTKTAYKLLRNNEIAHLKIGRAYKIPKSHVIAYLQKCGASSESNTSQLE